MRSGPAPGGVSAEERLSKLTGLKTKGLITDQEYQERRGQVLSEV